MNDIIILFLAGESSAEEDMILRNWLAQSDENLAEFTEIEKTWNSAEITLRKNQFDSTAAFSRFQSAITRKPKGSKVLHLNTLLKTTARWAAVIIFFVSTGAAATYLINNYRGHSGANVFEVQAPAGSRSQVNLSDGTTVWLNANSKLVYSSDFGLRDRIVKLEGEGYFIVNKSETHPFTVLTSDLEITALGTSFNIKSYPEENIIQTTLVSGSVLVSRSQFKEREKGLVLEPNQQITYFIDSKQMLLTHENEKTAHTNRLENEVDAGTMEPASSRLVLRKGVDTYKFTAWKDNRLIFDDELFETIAVKLERRFGVRIHIQDEEIRTKRFKGRFDEITIEQALKALQFASPFDFQIKQDTIYIRK